jgi:hypothetical protein
MKTRHLIASYFILLTLNSCGADSIDTIDKSRLKVTFEAGLKSVLADFDSSGMSVASIHWDLGDGTQVDTGMSVRHSYELPGTYLIVCRATLADASQYEESASVVIYPPAFTIEELQGYRTLTILFEADNEYDTTGSRLWFDHTSRWYWLVDTLHWSGPRLQAGREVDFFQGDTTSGKKPTYLEQYHSQIIAQFDAIDGVFTELDVNCRFHSASTDNRSREDEQNVIRSMQVRDLSILRHSSDTVIFGVQGQDVQHSLITAHDSTWGYISSLTQPYSGVYKRTNFGSRNPSPSILLIFSR